MALLQAGLDRRDPLTPEEMWAAVSQRNHRFDLAFVYAVRTTGIYCRPSCPARRPRQHNVVFFRTYEDAEREGFRACRRCRPRSPETAAEQSIKRARDYIDTHLEDSVTLDTLATEVGLSPFHLQRVFKRCVGLSPKAYQNARRLESFKTCMKKGKTVLEATYESGYGSSRSLYEQAGAGLGMTPGTYRRGGRGLIIRYGILESALGRVLVGSTTRGVCAVSLGDNEASLEVGLQDEFPNAVIEREDEMVRRWAEPIIRYIEGFQEHPAVPLDLQGTDFQRRVWQALQEIPYGETRTYSDIAASVGQPRAWRAVAQACASNKAAIVVPCHRVVRKDNTPGGYRWGVDRKQLLLEQEREGRTD